jgi:glutamate racemase
MEKGIDAIVLGCTHYPLVIPLIQEIAGPKIRVIDPAPAVARQAARLLEKSGGISRGQAGAITFFSSSIKGRLGELLPAFLGEDGEVRVVTWQGGTIKIDGG